MARTLSLTRLTRERLAQLPVPYWTLPDDEVEVDEDGETPVPECTLGVIRDDGSLWVINVYDPESDIAEGVLIVPEGLGFSEHGSIYGQALLKMHEVVGFKPVTFAKALMEWCYKDHSEVITEVAEAISA